MTVPINKTTVGAAIIITLLIYAGIQTERAARLKAGKELAEDERDLAVSLATGEKKKTEFYLNKNQELVAKTEENQLTIAGLNKLRDTERLAYLKKFESLKRDMRNLQSAGTIDLTVDTDSINRKIVYVPCADSVKAWHYVLKDQYNDISAMVIDTPRFDISGPVHTVRLWERKKVLGLKIGRKVFKNETTSPNKLIRITGQEFFEVRKKERK